MFAAISRYMITPYWVFLISNISDNNEEIKLPPRMRMLRGVQTDLNEQIDTLLEGSRLPSVVEFPMRRLLQYLVGMERFPSGIVIAPKHFDARALCIRFGGT